MIWSILHSASQVWLLAGLLSAFVGTSLLGMTVWRRQRIYSNMSRLIAPPSGDPSNRRSGSTNTHVISRIANHWPLLLVACTGLSLSGNVWLIWREFHRQSFVEMHDVRVLDRKDGYVFQMDVADPDTQERRTFMIRFCPDYKPTEEMQAGTSLLYLKFERHDFCEEIAPDNLGYALRRDDHGKPIRFR